MTKNKPKNLKDLQKSVKNKSNRKINFVFNVIRSKKFILFCSVFVIFFLSKEYLLRFVNQFLKTNTTNDLKITQKLKFVSIKTDGILPINGIEKFLNIPIGSEIMNFDLLKIRERLESISQIRTAEVERIFPDTIKINISEHKHILKILSSESHKLWFVSEEGIVFKPIGGNFDHMPFLSGITLKQEKIENNSNNNSYYSHEKNSFIPVQTRFKPINSVKIASNLLKLAKLKYKNLYKTWNEISFLNFDERKKAFWSTIVVKTTDGIEIHFGTQDFAEQLLRLDNILKYTDKNKKDIIKIDLSIRMQTVEFQKKVKNFH